MHPPLRWGKLNPMRMWLGFGVLASLFWMASAWQSRQTQRIRRQREQLHGTLPQPHEEATQVLERAGWSTLILGRPSGALPIPEARGDIEARYWSGVADAASPGVAGSNSTRRTQGPSPAPSHPETPAIDDVSPVGLPFTYRVRRGDVLGLICSDYYGTERGPFANLAQLTAAVARFNGLESPDSLKSGQIIELPPLDALNPGGPSGLSSHAR